MTRRLRIALALPLATAFAVVAPHQVHAAAKKAPVAKATAKPTKPPAKKTTPAAPAAAAAPAQLTVTMFVLPQTGVTDSVRADVERDVDSALHLNTHLNVEDSGTLLAQYSGEIPSSEIAAASQSETDADAAMASQTYPLAEKKYRDAVAVFEKYLPYIHKQDLADSMEGLGGALAAESQGDQALATFTSLLVWRPDQEYDATRHGAAGAPFFTQAQAAVAKLPTGSMKITSTPVGAQAFVDGTYVGVTPIDVPGLTAGDHYVTYKQEGFNKAIVKGTVDPTKENTAGLTLVKNPKYAAIVASLQKASANIGKPTADPALVNLRTQLFIDQVVVVKVAPAAKGSFTVDAYLYDLRTQQRLTHATQTATDAQLPGAAPKLATSLYTGVSYSLTAPPPPAAVKAPTKVVAGGGAPGATDTSTPLTHKWWFWAGMTAVVVGAVAVTVVATQSSSGAGCASGSACAQISW
jgi:hypothetical protein